ncbi:hypothetical protein V8C34DRAFT_273106 [Trichoderma compactum]
MHFIRRQGKKKNQKPSRYEPIADLPQVLPNPGHASSSSAHDGDWRCRCRNPKRNQKPFQETPERQLVLVRATGWPESGHCSPPEWARRRAERKLGGLFGCTRRGLLCAVRCSMGWGTAYPFFCLSSFFIGLLLDGNNAARVWVLDEG